MPEPKPYADILARIRRSPHSADAATADHLRGRAEANLAAMRVHLGMPEQPRSIEAPWLTAQGTRRSIEAHKAAEAAQASEAARPLRFAQDALRAAQAAQDDALDALSRLQLDASQAARVLARRAASKRG